MLKKRIIISFLLSSIIAFSPTALFATNIERIPSADQIKYFKVVKQENNTLYGIRILATPEPRQELGTDKTSALNGQIERIPSADQLKYFKVVKRENNTLYGIRILTENDSSLIDGKLRMTKGQASWYKYKNGLFAASPDYPKGSVLRVKNLDNGKSVEVVVNDYGPERNIHPDRVIDLDYVAFTKIASAGVGLVPVSVQPISISGSSFNKAEENKTKLPEIESLSALVIRESDGKVMYEKNAEEVLPIASLTKLVFAKVFMNLNIDWEKEVSYKYQDEKYNHQYCEAWESSRLRLSEGDVLKIKDLFHVAIVGSANNVVETLVRNSGMTREAFVFEMNNYVQGLGLVDTKFVEPTGLSTENVSSVSDYAIIAKEVFRDQKLKEISTLSSYSLSTINTKKEFKVRNTNKYLENNSYRITGSKTGYLHEAGYCLVTRAKTNNDNFIVINLNAKTRDDSFKDNEKLIKFSLEK